MSVATFHIKTALRTTSRYHCPTYHRLSFVSIWSGSSEVVPPQRVIKIQLAPSPNTGRVQALAENYVQHLAVPQRVLVCLIQYY